MGTALSELRLINSYLPRASTGLMPTPRATSLLLLQLGLVRKEDQCQIKKLSTPVKSFFALWQSLGEVPTQMALERVRGKFKYLSVDKLTDLQGQPGQGFLSKMLQQGILLSPVDYCEG